MSGSDALLVARCCECWLVWVAALTATRHKTRRVTAGGTDSPVAKLLARTPPSRMKKEEGIKELA